MSVPFHTQLQPFEEHQSPSPTEELSNPYELSLSHSRSRSPPGKNRLAGPPSPTSTVNNLQRQLSGDPDNPPPAWQRRPSINTQKSGKSSHSIVGSTRTRRTPSDASSTPSIPNLPPSARRHLNLTMTATTRNAAGGGLPGQLFLHESPSGSVVSLTDLGLPQPAFRRRQGGSNRSSISSSHDLSSLTSEELWSMDQEVIADMSNPLTRSAERPLDTVRRMSSRIEHSPYRNGLPQDVIWPSAPADDIYVSPAHSKSVTSMASLRSPNKNKRMSRQNSRLDGQMVANAKKGDAIYSKSTPVSPQDPVMISSNNSSSTSLASHVIKPTLSQIGLNSRPPSVYYSRDFLSSLAPREGGYAIAATMGNGLGAVGTMSVEERRRSGISTDERPRSNARAPVSRSAGMGRWSLDGGEHYGRPYGNPSNATTSTSIGRATSNSASDQSPPADEESTRGSYLPEGAASPATVSSAPESASPPPLVQTSVPINPSPLGREAAAADLPTPSSEAAPAMSAPVSAIAVPTPPPIPASQPPPLNTKKSKKELKVAAKEAKAADKAAAAKVAAQRAEQAKQAALKREADKLAAKKKKEDDKRKAKEEKERKKAEKKAAKSKPTPVVKAPTAAISSVTAAKTPAAASDAPSAAPAVQQTSQAVPVPQELGAKPSSIPFPRTQSDHKVPSAANETPRQTTTSMPLASSPAPRPAPPPQSPSSKSLGKARLGMFGTIRKRLSVFGSDLKSPQNNPGAERLPPVPPTPPKHQPSMNASPVPVTGTTATAPIPAGAELERVVTPQTTHSSSQSPLTDLPPRSSSHNTPIVMPTPTVSSPQSFQTTGVNTPTPTLNRAHSHQSYRDNTSSPLSKNVQNESRAGGSPSSIRKGGSLRGPRPMPRSANSPDHRRPESITTSLSDKQNIARVETNGAQESMTPSDSSVSNEGDSSAFSHYMSKDSQGTDLASPFTSDGSEVMEYKRDETPEREGSNETVHPFPANQTIAAH